ncbi:cytochrome b5 [Daedalea quercina L-15889]|uniref:Cytochrome b5 n=1 Tax=Daedalea quercina L-15889 TaxID=1314783 RepID=A0A165U7B8_9APHY|nr:cytochrome b5 [Daedalea quercina L-15889]
MPDVPGRDDYPKVPDPAFPDRMVSTKQANRPFLNYSEYRTKREAEHAAWLERKKEREERLARGEEVGSEEPDPTEELEVGCLGLLKAILYLTVFALLAGKFITGSFLWEHELPNFKKWIPTNQRLFSERMLSTFDGSDDTKPIYLAIDGDVYDVTPSRLTYGPGGPYHQFAGKDAARAFGTGCFSTHLTHDLRGLSDDELKGVENWKQFYANSKKYVKIGRVSHPPIDPASPILEHCDAKKAKARRSPEQVEDMKQHQQPRSGPGRNEL